MIKPKLSLLDITMAVVSLIIGMGIFIAPSSVAKETGTPTLFFSAWILGGIFAIFGGLTFAEIGSRLPRAGGYYKVISEVYHPSLAFMLNWMNLLVSCASSAIVAIIGCKYLSPFIQLEFIHTPAGLKVFASTVILVLFVVNYLGIKTGAGVLNLLTIVKIVLILAFSIAAIFISSQYTTIQPPTTIPNNHFLPALLFGLVAVSFTYGGYQVAMNFGADIKNPKKNLPTGIIIGVLIVVTLYLLINIGYFKVLGMAHIAASDLLARDMAEVILGKTAGNIISIVIFISVLGFLNVTIMQNPRIYYALAEDGLLPKTFKKINEKTQVQETGLIFNIALVLFFIMLQGTFDNILNYIMFNDTIVMSLIASSVFILRAKSKEKFDGFKSPLYPVLPAIYIIYLLSISVSAAIRMNNMNQVIISIGLIVVGYPLYLLLKKAVGLKKST